MNYLERAKEFRAKKRLGQNFLICEDAIDTILEEANLSKDDTVLEIGPGVGFVTEQLVDYAKKVIAVEIDSDAIGVLSNYAFENLEIIENDILKTDVSNLSDKKIKVVANIPYYITSPILVHLLGEIDELVHKNRDAISEILLMVQYEVAQRIVADEKSPSKQYGLLSILSNFWADTKIIKKVPAKCFFPRPKVDSAIVKLTLRDKPIIECENPKFLRRVIKAGFATRRKTLKNALSQGGFDKNIIPTALEKAGIDSSRRGETLSVYEFKKLADALTEVQNNAN